MSDQREGPTQVMVCDMCRWLHVSGDGSYDCKKARQAGERWFFINASTFRTPAWCPCLPEGDNQQTKGTNDGN